MGRQIRTPLFHSFLSCLPTSLYTGQRTEPYGARVAVVERGAGLWGRAGGRVVGAPHGGRPGPARATACGRGCHSGAGHTGVLSGGGADRVDLVGGQWGGVGGGDARCLGCGRHRLLVAGWSCGGGRAGGRGRVVWAGRLVGCDCAGGGVVAWARGQLEGSSGEIAGSRVVTRQKFRWIVCVTKAFA